MPSSKDMQPFTAPYFPTLFIKAHFRTSPVWPPKTTDLSGKVAIVTGANQGLGFTASDQLLSYKLSHLIIAVRSKAKGDAAAKSLQIKYPKAKIDVYLLDMSSYDSIVSFIKEVERLPRLDMAILNSGVRNNKFIRNPDTGHEDTIQVNFLSTVLLAILLLPILKGKSANGPGRLTLVNSGLAYGAKCPSRGASPFLPSFDNEKSFDGMEIYGTSKMLSHAFLYKLGHYVSAEDVIVNAADPGFVKGTNFGTDKALMEKVMLAVMKVLAARTAAVGASSYVDAVAVKGRESHCSVLTNWEVAPFASLLYTLEGKQMVERLWSETMAELEFAGVQSVLDGMSSRGS